MYWGGLGGGQDEGTQTRRPELGRTYHNVTTMARVRRVAASRGPIPCFLHAKGGGQQKTSTRGRETGLVRVWFPAPLRPLLLGAFPQVAAGTHAVIGGWETSYGGDADSR